MAVQFIPVMSEEQITALAFMADTVWHEWFQTLLSPTHDYMVDKFQSIPALRKQIVKKDMNTFSKCKWNKCGIYWNSYRTGHKEIVFKQDLYFKTVPGKRYAVKHLSFWKNVSGISIKIYLPYRK